jgi:nucleotide-binding universal stress UspA family protein
MLIADRRRVMTDTLGPVVVGIDGATQATAGDVAAIRVGAWEATRRHVGLHLVHSFQLVPPWADADLDTADRPAERARDALQHLVERTALAHPALAVTGVVSGGSPGNALIVASGMASLVVVSADSRVHYGGLLAGLVSIQVAAHARTPVIVVPASDRRPDPIADRRVVVGVDGSPGSADAVAFAVEEAWARDATLHAVYVWEWPTRHGLRPLFEHAADVAGLQAAADRMLREATALWEDKYPDVVVVRDAVHGDNPIRALNDAGAGADLIVVGARGHGGFATLLLGSVADGLVRYSAHTVAVARTACSVGSK